MKGKVIKYEQDNIDTDVILPGPYLKLHEHAELAEHAMEGMDPDFHSKVKEANIIVTGKNFGCGSSREHAPIALSASGIEAILALSFARIFYRNSVDGAYLLPIEIDEKTYSAISEKDELEIDTNTNVIKNITKNQTYSMKPFPDLIGKIIEAGGLFKYKP
ncbi:3-isopropylmalate dehydratase small subunit [Marine Group I thaumarchaeote]|jgi:3-isopropylmalate/(R)-2-methylmalate dehydratase small subunit|uniref:3-isopropylmalate dehydratase small subunit n=4 Tax=Nitrososphaerota TaxID=651137 RepID=A0A7K4NN79_9ARCH|nr:putative aconitase C-terminal domain protein [uncultured marine crenarchaeote HF4000_APKG5E24]ABZ09175.1 putative aconitase C-terminal domain protein [uncultured marine crenarchaeote HF4000_APKG6J21]ABZ09638.1 putative aconitase C-terminal domain protein [uncultured marine crenarchaeote HF4000_APKG8G2]NWJ99210.1 3-isopropylmalate dehydratase small subunit [Marine Group I thaumarchaeote]NWK02062.1 3-isopropylmalate dehydratase small subunit [Marine Group I thaumarchaeote]